MPAQIPPNGFEFKNAFQARSTGIVSAIDGADARANHHIGGDAVGGERVHHANLYGAKTAATRKNERRFLRLILAERRQSSSLPAMTPASIKGAACAPLIAGL